MRLAEASTEKCPASVCAVTAAALSVHRGALRRLDEAVDLLVGETGEPARLGGDRDRHRLGVAGLADAAQVEPLVDRLLELDRAATPLGIALGQRVEPFRAHADAGDLVGQA